ncbi:hypothetical protein [Aureliella helgolandensis]|uniref:hypothetical protein n=1 Tax=Aureliella helgolandensis TaxID=2527968 RepID=UPI0018D1C897|nr:hypothetical protein [Aureliella helgolandensis]
MTPYREVNGGSSAQPYEEQHVTALRGIQRLKTSPNLDVEAAKLERYLQPFIERYGENLPASLVAVVAGSVPMRQLLNKLLESAYDGSMQDFGNCVLGDVRSELSESIQKTRFIFEMITEDSIEVETLTGDLKVVPLSDNLESLVVGDPKRLSSTYYYYNASGSERASYKIVRLRSLREVGERFEAIPIFSKTIETILIESHCNGRSSLCPTDISGGLERIADTSQTRLRTSQLAILNNARDRLAHLGLRDMPPFNEVYQKLVQADRLKVAAKDLAERKSSSASVRAQEAEESESAAIQQLEQILRSAEVESLDVLTTALREKLIDFEYDARSVPNEVFQNADDAASELRHLCKQDVLAAAHFFLRFNSETRLLEFFHWGRPVNRHKYPGFDSGRQYGFDEDVHKMLTHGHSDKHRRIADSQNNATGRFGLGFKSVFFLSDTPRVISDSLAFEVRGGFYPVSLASDEATHARDAAKALFATTAAVTVFQLPLRSATELPNERIGSVLDEFSRNAQMLCLFAREIRSIEIQIDETNIKWSMKQTLLQRESKILLSEINGRDRAHRYITFRCPIAGDTRSAEIAMQVGVNGPEEIDGSLSGIWCTTRLSEESSCHLAINGPFKPDAGRQSLAFSSNNENHSIAKQIARGWGTALIDLFDCTSENFNQLAVFAGFHSHINFEIFWERFFKLVGSVEVVGDWSDVQTARSMIGWISYSPSYGAIRNLMTERAAIPTGFSGRYAKMVRLRDVEFVLQGLADKKPEWFEAIVQFELVRKHFPPGSVVTASVGSLIRKLVETEANNDGSGSTEPAFQVLRLIELLRIYAPGDKVGADSAQRIWNWFSIAKPFEIPPMERRDEHHDLEEWLKSLKFLTRSGEFKPASDLLCGHDELPIDLAISDDEYLRAQIAPTGRVLAEEYSTDGLSLFLLARKRLTADAGTLAEWVKSASSDKLPAIFSYLLEGDLRFDLAKLLTVQWLKEHQTSRNYSQLDESQKNELMRNFAEKGRYTIQLLDTSPMPSYANHGIDLSPAEAFEEISRWWSSEQVPRCLEYDSQSYPPGFPGLLLWPDEEGWEAERNREGWLLLFIAASLGSLGMNQIGRNLNFLQFLVDQDWLSVLLRSESDSAAVVQAVNDYLNEFVQRTRYHFQMRQFIGFLASAKNLDALVASLRDADQLNNVSSFNFAFTPRANSMLEGLDIDSPPIADILGIGASFILRELYRKGRLTASEGFGYAFMPTSRVRLLCENLFNIRVQPWRQSTQSIFSELSDFDGDATFNRCFDLPLLLLAHNPRLQIEVLGGEIDFDSNENKEAIDDSVE